MNPRLFFLHGWAGNNRVWHELIMNLSSKYECIAPDLNTLFAEKEEEIFSALSDMVSRLEPVYLCGWSLGAVMALQLVITFNINVKGIVIFNGTGYFCAPDGAGRPPKI